MRFYIASTKFIKIIILEYIIVIIELDKYIIVNLISN